LRATYAFERELGRGGTAVVYLARDLKHDRLVAVKALHPELAHAVGAERFLREIQILGHLSHPHILPLFDSGFANGCLYYVMPYVEESLRDRLRRERQLPLDEVVRVGSQVATALDYAHRQGAVHRDIKPENILLSPEGNVLLADFGIARSIGESVGGPLTETGLTLGTPAYMSPEQASGEAPIDGRSDIYGLGCVLFEMLAGESPFTGPTAQAVIAKRFAQPAPSLRVVRAAIPEPIAATVARALAREPADRHQTASQMAVELQRGFSQPPVPDTFRLPAAARGSPRARFAAVAALLLAALGAVVALRERSDRAAALERSTTAADAGPSIAVLPFRNMSDDRANEYFSDGMTDELTGALARIPGLSVSARSSAFVFKGKNATPRAVGDSLHVGTVLDASVFRSGQSLHVVATLVDAKTGRTMWSETYDREWRDVLALQTEIAQSIATQLQVKLGRAAISLTKRQTANPEAYDNYLKGRYFFDQRTAPAMDSAGRYFRKALSIDSTYARAYSGLADSYSLLAILGSASSGDMFPQAREAAERALAFDSLLAEAHVSRAIISTFYEWDWSSAQREINRAIALDSTAAPAYFWSTWSLAFSGRVDDGLRAVSRARALDPLLQVYNTRVGTILAWQHRYPEAEAQLRKTLEITPGFGSTRVQLARVLVLQGRFDEAIAALPPRELQVASYETGIAGFVLARAGKREAALKEIKALAARPYVTAVGIAIIYVGLGDKNAAFAWLERAYATRESNMVFLINEPMFDSVRDDPRFRRLVMRIHKP